MKGNIDEYEKTHDANVTIEELLGLLAHMATNQEDILPEDTHGNEAETADNDTGKVPEDIHCNAEDLATLHAANQGHLGN